MAIERRFKEHRGGGNRPAPDWPLERFAAVVKADDADLDFETRALILSADGVVKVTGAYDHLACALPLTKGINWIAVERVWDTGTDEALTIVAAD